MKKALILKSLFSYEELITLQSLITQGAEKLYVHNEYFTHYNNQDRVLSSSFKSKILIRFSCGYYLFQNDLVLNRFREFVHKLEFKLFNFEHNNDFNEYNEVLEFNFFINHIEVYSTYNEALDSDYSEISDTLIVFVSDAGKKIGIVADEDFQNSILFWYDTQMIESKLLFQTLNDMVTPKFNKRVEIEYDKVSYLLHF